MWAGLAMLKILKLVRNSLDIYRFLTMHMVPTSVNIESFAVADLHSKILDACPLPSAIFFIFIKFSETFGNIIS